jgi:anti-sigma-K factor RskA
MIGGGCPLQDDAAAYVLGALEPAEVERYRNHLTRCAPCRKEVEALQPVVQRLRSGMPPAEPPGRVLEQVMAQVRAEADLLRSAEALPEAFGARSAGGARRRRVPRSFALAGALACALGALVLALVLAPGGSRQRLLISASVSPALEGARGTVVEQGGVGRLVLEHMPQPPHGKIYELWVARPGGQPEATGTLFTVTSGGLAQIGLPRDLRRIAEVMVTAEPLGGTSRPTEPPLVDVRL